MTGATCLVTGGSGFIGTHLIREILRQSRYDRVIVLDRVPPRVEDRRVEYVEADLREPPRVHPRGPIDDLYHLAAVCKEPGYETEEYFAHNHQGTVHLCALADRLQIPNLIHTSTMMVFPAGDRRCREEDPADPDTAYGASKLRGEEACRAWRHESPGRRLRILRIAVVFGQDGGGNFLRLHDALRRRRFAYIGRRSTIKSWIYVRDVVDALLYFAGDDGVREILNVAYPEPTTIETIAREMCGTFGLPDRIPVIPYRPALVAARIAESLGAKDIHPRRIQKLHNSTDISPRAMVEAGFTPAWDLPRALADWRDACAPAPLS